MLTLEQALAAARLVAARCRSEYPDHVNVERDVADLASHLRYGGDAAVPERIGTRADVEAEVKRVAAAMGLDSDAGEGALAAALTDHESQAIHSTFGVVSYDGAMEHARWAAMQAATASPGTSRAS